MTSRSGVLLRLLRPALGLAIAGAMLRVGVWAAQLYASTGALHVIMALYMGAIAMGITALVHASESRHGEARGEPALPYVPVALMVVGLNISLMQAGRHAGDIALASLAVGPAVLLLYALVLSVLQS